MQSVVKRLGLLCAGGLLLACAEMEQQAAAPAPVVLASPAALANEAYLLGRGAHMANRFDEAVASYEAALRAEPAHVNARNGLATVYAEQGDFPRAIALWRGLTEERAGQAGPHSAFLFSNLGYAQFLNGEYEQALGALEKACVLDPLNYRAWRHLGNALDKLGQHARAQQMLRQAAALQQHDFKADYAATSGSGVAAIAKAVLAPERSSQQWAETQIHTDASGMLTLRRVEANVATAAPVVAAPLRQAAQALTELTAAAPHTLPNTLPHTLTNTLPNALLEIRNGNGVTGMARALASRMTAPVQVVRLTNQKGFAVQRTRVEYQGEFREAAERLAARFGAATVVPVEHVGRADMRLVIGHDLVGKQRGGPAPAAAARVASTAEASALRL